MPTKKYYVIVNSANRRLRTYTLSRYGKLNILYAPKGNNNFSIFTSKKDAENVLGFIHDQGVGKNLKIKEYV